ncbi:PREDICTED: cation/H(+) antiporter 28 [Nelumbo nucifera]|uniref:Cation/H(+) antiporter 28 n=2 Tax=Nelumbo nucifera TaxID=4432 RepID=A0A1U8A7A7_NELNU|nr:PREDICTED: cation/H(+) antiporter 28 [Nelumbo nucifera]DAD42389.1 TPA_asm: hypothetical protein HUJ06_000619 [Nelumbo nucifera]
MDGHAGASPSPPKGCIRLPKEIAAMTAHFFVISYFVAVLFILVSCSIVHGITRHISQPRIISEIIVGLLYGNLGLSRIIMRLKIARTLHAISELGMVCYMLVLGLEMDPSVLFRRPTREAMVAYSGMLSTFIVACLVAPLLSLAKEPIMIKFIITLAVALSGTASPLLTRLITELKIGKSEIGRLAVGAGMHTDMVSLILISFGLIIYPTSQMGVYFSDFLFLVFAMIIQIFLMVKTLPRFVRWINDNNPEGKAMKATHLVLAITVIVIVCCFGPLAAVSPIINSFVTGLIIPRAGRLSKMMTGKLNYFLGVLFYPIYFFWVGMQANLKHFKANDLRTWSDLILIFLIATVGKVSGTVVSGKILGYNWSESIALGLLLNIKGHFHIYCSMMAYEVGAICASNFMQIILATVLTIVYIPLVVAFIVSRARKRSQVQHMTLQWQDPLSEIRMLLCLHGPHNVASAINIMEVSRGAVKSKATVFATEMIELNAHTAATLGGGKDADAVTVFDEAVMNQREQIANVLQRYMAKSGKGIHLHRVIALSTFDNMHRDICNIAEDVVASFIILPFHKNLKLDGRVEKNLAGYRHVNRKVLRHAPCSVGILVDKGLQMKNIKDSGSHPSLNVAVIFIGGRDDWEALAYASRVSLHPGVNLTVIRFLHDSKDQTGSIRGSSLRFSESFREMEEMEEEMKLDNEYFAQFYERRVATGQVGYEERYVVNSAEMVYRLRRMKTSYELFIVGRGGGVNSILTVGIDKWQQFPELGPIGDMLSSNDFSHKASVLIIQQHTHKRSVKEDVNDEILV